MNPQRDHTEEHNKDHKQLLRPKAGILIHSMQNCTKMRRNCKLDDDPIDIDEHPMAYFIFLKRPCPRRQFMFVFDSYG
jgi:hypothetical protein